MIRCVCLLIACIVLISSTNAITLPGNYTLPPNSAYPCFVGRFNLTLNVEYLKFDGKRNTTKIPLNNETFQSYDGTCLSVGNTHLLTITMLDNLTTVSLEFFLNEKNQTLLRKVFATININSNDYFANYSGNVAGPHIFSANESLFATDRTYSYRCNSRTKIDNFKCSGNVTLTSIDLEDLRIQPFVDGPFADYAAEKVCTMDILKNSNLIPIIVGVCLALLVVIVLVAYLIGRRRNRNGYQSV